MIAEDRGRFSVFCNMRTANGRPYGRRKLCVSIKMNKKIIYRRKEHRLKNFDYSSANAYFITICVKNREPILWQCVPKENVGAAIGRPSDRLSVYGKVIDEAINKIPQKYEFISVDNYVIMPNHIHLLLSINKLSGETSADISRVVNQMKGYVTKQLGFSLWQKLYHDRVIRNEEEYLNKWQYIDENPIRWEEDDEYII